MPGLRALGLVLARIGVVLLLLAVIGVIGAIRPLSAEELTERALFQARFTSEYGFVIERRRGEATERIEGEIASGRAWAVFSDGVTLPVAVQSDPARGWQQRTKGMAAWVPSSTGLDDLIGEAPLVFAERLLREVREVRSERDGLLAATVPCSNFDPLGDGPLGDLLTGVTCFIEFSVDRDRRLQTFRVSVPRPVGEAAVDIRITFTPPGRTTPEALLAP